MKAFAFISAGLFIAAEKEKTTIINTGLTPITVVDVATKKALEELPEIDQKHVESILHSIAPGSSLKLNVGEYHIGMSEYSSKAIAMREFTPPKTAPAPAPETPQV